MRPTPSSSYIVLSTFPILFAMAQYEKPANCLWTINDCDQVNDLNDVDFITNCYKDISNYPATCESLCKRDRTTTSCQNYCPEYLEACKSELKANATVSPSTLFNVITETSLSTYSSNSSSHPTNGDIVENTTTPNNLTESLFTTTRTVNTTSQVQSLETKDSNISTVPITMEVVTSNTTNVSRGNTFTTEQVRNDTTEKATQSSRVENSTPGMKKTPGSTAITSITYESQPSSKNLSLPTTFKNEQTPDENTEENTSKEPMPVGGAIGIAVAIIVFVLIVALIICKVKKRYLFEYAGDYNVVDDASVAKSSWLNNRGANGLKERESNSSKSSDSEANKISGAAENTTRIPNRSYEPDKADSINELDQSRDKLLQ